MAAQGGENKQNKTDFGFQIKLRSLLKPEGQVPKARGQEGTRELFQAEGTA